MGDRTRIQWTNATWNPLRGCSRISEGCRNCYAEAVAGRFSGPGQPYEGLVSLGAKGPRWNGEIMEVRHKLMEPIRWTNPRMVFVNSMSDLFHESVSSEYIAAVFGVMAAAPQHTFQILTKRPKRMREWFRWAAREQGGAMTTAAFCALRTLEPEYEGPFHSTHCPDPDGPWPLPNVWLGVSVEDQTTADERIPSLLECPAAIRWVSYEPALGPVDFNMTPAPLSWTPINGATREDLRGCLSRWQEAPLQECELFHGLDWIVVGGESGPRARPFHVDWARSVIRQCAKARTPVFIKQLGARASNPLHGITLKAKKGDNMDEWPEDIRVREWPEVGSG